jgi:hypothetical protein
LPYKLICQITPLARLLKLNVAAHHQTEQTQPSTHKARLYHRLGFALIAQRQRQIVARSPGWPIYFTR